MLGIDFLSKLTNSRLYENINQKYDVEYEVKS